MRSLLLAPLLLSGCVVVQPAPPTTPAPIPVTRPTPTPEPACRADGPVFYRETRQALANNDAVPREQITIYHSGAFVGGKRGHGCLTAREMTALRASLTAARMETRPRPICRAMPYMEITAEIDAVGSVTWRAPCAPAPDAETMRGVELARKFVDGAPKSRAPERCEAGGAIVFRQWSEPLHGDAPGDDLTIYASGAWTYTGYEDREGCLTERELDTLRASLTVIRKEDGNRAVCAAMPNSEVTIAAPGVGSITYEAPCSIGPDEETMEGVNTAHDLTLGR